MKSKIISMILLIVVLFTSCSADTTDTESNRRLTRATTETSANVNSQTTDTVSTSAENLYSNVTDTYGDTNYTAYQNETYAETDISISKVEDEVVLPVILRTTRSYTCNFSHYHVGKGEYVLSSDNTLKYREVRANNSENSGSLVTIFEDVRDFFVSDEAHTTMSGISYGFVLKNDNSLWAWGYNANGELGEVIETVDSSGYLVAQSFRSANEAVKIADDVANIYLEDLNNKYFIKTDRSLWKINMDDLHKSELIGKDVIDIQFYEGIGCSSQKNFTQTDYQNGI